MPTIWTTAVRLELFKQLVERYGPHNTWEKKTLPGHGRDEDYKEFLETFAKYHGVKSAAAVSLKIEHVFFLPGAPDNVKWAEKDTLLSIAAAEEAGFIPVEDEN